MNINDFFNKKTPLAGVFKYLYGDPEGSRTLDFLDENQTSWTTRRRDHTDILTEKSVLVNLVL